MANGNGQGAGKTWLEEYPDLRNKYFYGQMVTAHDLHNAQDYLLERIKALSLLLNGPGVVYGLDVTNVRRGNTRPDITLDLTAGFAIDGLGRHVVVPDDVEGEGVLCEAEEGMPLKEPQRDDVVIFYLEREECRTGKIPAYGGPSPCGQSCCYSRIRESYKITGRVLSAEKFNDVLGVIEYYLRKVDKDLLGIKGDAGIEDVLKLILRYAHRYQPSVSAFLDNLVAHYRVNERGGVAIWAGTYGAIPKEGKTTAGNPAEENKLALLFRRNVLSNETLAQMVAEHATDYDNPHRTPRSELIHGKYTLRGALGRVEPEKKWVEHAIDVGPLTYADGEPVTGTATSISVGWSIRLKTTGSYEECKVKYENILGFGVPEDPVFRAMQESVRDDFYGYYTEWLTGARDLLRINSPLSCGTGPILAVAGQSQGLRWISLVPGVPFEEGREQLTLRIYVTEGLSNFYKELNGEIIEVMGQSIEDKFPQVYGAGTEGQFKRKEFEETFGGSDFLDLDIIIYWSAAVTDLLDMDQAEDAKLSTVPSKAKKTLGGGMVKASGKEGG